MQSAAAWSDVAWVAPLAAAWSDVAWALVSIGLGWRLPGRYICGFSIHAPWTASMKAALRRAIALRNRASRMFSGDMRMVCTSQRLASASFSLAGMNHSPGGMPTSRQLGGSSPSVHAVCTNTSRMADASSMPPFRVWYASRLLPTSLSPTKTRSAAGRKMMSISLAAPWLTTEPAPCTDCCLSQMRSL